MDQIKIGKFIAERRKNAKLTQLQLAEKLDITDRVVSKWETGKAMPDSSIMLELCDVLGISVNDLLCGEIVTMDNYNKELESNLLEMIKQKEENDRRLLRMEIVMGIIAILPLLAAVVIVSVVPMEEWLGGLIAGLSLIPLLIEDYKAVTLVDLRYVDVAQLGRFVEFEGRDVLFLHSALVLNKKLI